MRIYYDEEGDYLEIFIGNPRPNYGEGIASEGYSTFAFLNSFSLFL